MREIALSKNGICLSAEYHNEREPLEWECAIGHRWMAKPRAISRQGTWCPVCAVEKRRSNRLSTLKTRRDSSQNDLDQVKEFARRLGGEYLSNNMPVNPDEKNGMAMRCGKGHIWHASLTMVILHRIWCPECTGRELLLRPRELDFELLREVAEARNGVCLADHCPGSVNQASLAMRPETHLVRFSPVCGESTAVVSRMRI